MNQEVQMIISVLTVATVTLVGSGLAAGACWVDQLRTKRNAAQSVNLMRQMSKRGKDRITIEAEQYVQDIDRMTRK